MMQNIATMKNPGESSLIAKTLELFQKARLNVRSVNIEQFVDELTSLFGEQFNQNVVSEIKHHFVSENLVFADPKDIKIPSIIKEIEDFAKNLVEAFSNNDHKH